VLRNAMIPILTNIGHPAAGHLRRLVPDRGVLLHPGPGPRGLLAVNRSDYPVIQAVTIYLAALTMVINLLTDLLYKWSIRGWCSNDRRDPRPPATPPNVWLQAWKRLARFQATGWAWPRWS
jgi:hypothetical protein